MAELIGVISPFDVLRPGFMKRTALLFDRIAVQPFSEETIDQWRKLQPDETNELLWMVENGLVFQASVPTSETLVNDEFEAEIRESTVAVQRHLVEVFGEDTFDSSREYISAAMKERLAEGQLDLEGQLRLIGHFMRATEHLTRIIGCLLRNEGYKAYPVLPFNLKANTNASATNVLEIVFKNFPTPDSQTPWEHILEFKRDPDSRAKLLDLNNWVNEVVRAKLSPVEAEEKLEYLLSQYRRHLQLHHMKSRSGIVESVVVSGAEIAENFVKIKWGKLAKMLFATRQRKISLMEGELTAPGNEVAYILKTQRKFS